MVKNTANKLTLRTVIDAKCRECIYDPQSEGSWRKQVENCLSPGCSLFPKRPISKGGKK